MMFLHVRSIKDPHQRVAQGRALIKWLAEAQNQTNAYSLLLREVDYSFATKSDAAIFHDDLAEVNAPVYFHQFIEHAARHGLQFLSEAEYFDTQEFNFPPAAAQQLRRLSEHDPIAREQYLDLLEGRSFRQTLLCHREVQLAPSLQADSARQFHIKSQARPVSTEPDLESEAVEEFRGPKESSISTSFPLAKAALVYLGQIYPRSTTFNELFANACEMLGRSSPPNDMDSHEVQSLAELMIKTYGAGITKFHLHQPKFALIPGERPLASPLARLQAEHGSTITTLLYDTVKLDDLLGRKLLMLLDGTRDRRAVLKDFSQIIQQSISDSPPESSREDGNLAQKLEDKLLELGQLGLLLA
jgi:methyltransferase-like protein